MHRCAVRCSHARLCHALVAVVVTVPGNVFFLFFFCLLNGIRAVPCNPPAPASCHTPDCVPFCALAGGRPSLRFCVVASCVWLFLIHRFMMPPPSASCPLTSAKQNMYAWVREFWFCAPRYVRYYVRKKNGNQGLYVISCLFFLYETLFVISRLCPPLCPLQRATFFFFTQIPVLRVWCDGQLAVCAFLPPLLAVLHPVPHGHYRRGLNHVGGSPGSQGEPL